ncbi:MAG: hypothetical protein ACREFK_13470, partial [Stellaceae bacterium]
MATVVMADDGIAFDGAMAASAPLGGAETAFVALAEALARRGHGVAVRNRCRAPVAHNGVQWASLADGVPVSCDLYIGNRGHRTIGLVRRAGVRLFWLHNPARYLKKPRNLWRLARWRPRLVVTGLCHRATVPQAELHIHAGPAVYGLAGTPAARHIESILARADRLAGRGVFRHPPLAHGAGALAETLKGARVMLYR